MGEAWGDPSPPTLVTGKRLEFPFPWRSARSLGLSSGETRYVFDALQRDPTVKKHIGDAFVRHSSNARRPPGRLCRDSMQAPTVNPLALTDFASVPNSRIAKR